MTVTNVTQTSNVLQAKYDLSKLLLGNNHFISVEVTSASGTIEIKQGMPLGRKHADGKAILMKSDATDGSELPVGVAILEQTVAEGETANITLVNKGKIAKDLLEFEKTGDDLDTVVSDRRYRDRFNDIGFILEETEELTDFDNE